MKTVKLHGHDFELKHLEGEYRRYLHSHNYKLSDCYDRWSERKQHAYDYCKELARECGWSSYGIVSHNTCMFTFGFVFECDDVKWFAYITKAHNYVMPLA